MAILWGYYNITKLRVAVPEKALVDTLFILNLKLPLFIL
jgi:hypothetical protein